MLLNATINIECIGVSINKGASLFIYLVDCVLLNDIIAILFFSGNVWVYKAWGEDPDFGHTWFSNGCDKSVFFLSFIAVIVLDGIIGILLIGCCFWGVSKVIVRE